MKKLLALLVCLCAALAGCSTPVLIENAVEEAPYIYYLNQASALDGLMQELAQRYTQRTGIPVSVLTPAEGTYGDALTAELQKAQAPTVFYLDGPADLQLWDNNALEVSGTQIADALTTSRFLLRNDAGLGKGLPISYQSYGLLVNLTLLEQAGYEISQLQDFFSLAAIADDIHARWEELGFDAFTVPGLDRTGSARFSTQLVSVPLYYEFRDRGISGQPAAITGTYLPHLRSIWELYMTDTQIPSAFLPEYTDQDAAAQFASGQAVFHQGGTWEYEEFSREIPRLAMIPLYCGAPGEGKAALCSNPTGYWAVNANASQGTIQATLDYLNWLVSDPYAAQKLVGALGVLPYSTAPEPVNPLLAAENHRLSQGCYPILWAYTSTPNPEAWRATVVTALTAYSAAPTDSNWQKVEDTIVDGWAYEYKMSLS